jgi:ABC-2 type transport system permease protein
MKTFYWLVKREFWEHRGGFLWTPVIVGGIFLLLNLMGIAVGEAFGAHHGMTMSGNNMHLFNQAMTDGDTDKIGFGLDMMMFSTSIIISIVLGFVLFFYCLGALYDDRKDRSLLFWKSLPISDTATVLSKVFSAAVLAPVIAVICGVLTGLMMLLMYVITLSFHGVSAWRLLTLAHPFQVIADLVGSIPLYVLWALPTLGWLLLCSAWARSKPFLWAVALPVGVGVVIGWFNLLGSISVNNLWYWKNVCGRVLLSIFPGGWLGQNHMMQLSDGGVAHALDFLHVAHAYQVLGTPSIWIEAAVGAAMIAGAIWLRRWRDDN